MKKSISYWSFVGKDPREAMSLAKQAGYDGIELTLDAQGSLGLTPETSDVEICTLRDEAAEFGIALPSLASGLYWAYSFTSDDASERRKAHETAVCQIHQAKLLGADTILVIPGSVAVEFVPERPVVPYDVCWERALESIRALVPIAEQAQVSIGIENVWNQFLLSPLEMRNFLDAVNSPWVGAYLDVGNVMYAGYPEHWIRILGNRIKKVHFKDFRRNPGGLNSFVDLLSGDVDWPNVMQAFEEIGYNGWAAAELIPQYRYAAEQMIFQASAAMDRILKKSF